jgi:hypothetical protein
MMVKGGAVIGRRAQVAVGSSEELRWKGDSGYKEWGSYIIEGSTNLLSNNSNTS